ncbi:MAG: PepSY-associated TM helix domain-containing protein, partial [Pseudomonadota bacterium]
NKRRGRLMRVSRTLHNYLSAFAFLMLIFFSASGILLNHPEWFDGNAGDKTRTVEGTIDTDDIVRSHADGTLDLLIRRNFPIIGEYKDLEDFDDELLLRFVGAKGSSFVSVDMSNGVVVVENERANAIEQMRALHKGDAAGQSWRVVIDISAGFILFLSIFGFILFFTMRFRLAKSLILCGSSLLLLGLIYHYLVL